MERRRIIKRLIKKFNPENDVKFNEDIIATASRYTGLHSETLIELRDSLGYEFKFGPIDRSLIYESLVKFYTMKAKIPNTYELYQSLHGILPPYIDIGNFRKILVKTGFIWKKVSFTSAVVIENPTVRFERYNYLKKIQVYRSANVDIYYIDVRSYDSKGNFRDVKLTKESVDGLEQNSVQKVIYAIGPNGILALEEIEDYSCDTVENWVRDSLMVRIETPSVFILSNNEYCNRKLLETPTLDSLKRDMKRWLDKHGVAYDDKMSKFCLFDLADRCTDLKKYFYKIDEILKPGGHSVLRLPESIAENTSAVFLARLIDANFPKVVSTCKCMNPTKSEEDSVAATKKMFESFIASASSMYIKEIEKYISSKEVEFIEMEDKVDHAYDMLMIKAISSTSKSKERVILEDSDFPSCDSE